MPHRHTALWLAIILDALESLSPHPKGLRNPATKGPCWLAGFDRVGFPLGTLGLGSLRFPFPRWALWLRVRLKESLNLLPYLAQNLLPRFAPDMIKLFRLDQEMVRFFVTVHKIVHGHGFCFAVCGIQILSRQPPFLGGVPWLRSCPKHPFAILPDLSQNPLHCLAPDIIKLFCLKPDMGGLFVEIQKSSVVLEFSMGFSPCVATCGVQGHSTSQLISCLGLGGDHRSWDSIPAPLRHMSSLALADICALEIQLCQQRFSKDSCHALAALRG